jgi:hypothetical protein
MDVVGECFNYFSLACTALISTLGILHTELPAIWNIFRSSRQTAHGFPDTGSPTDLRQLLPCCATSGTDTFARLMAEQHAVNHWGNYCARCGESLVAHSFPVPEYNGYLTLETRRLEYWFCIPC